MEMTALKGSSGDLQHFADRIFAERGVRYGRVAMIPTSAKMRRRPKAADIVSLTAHVRKVPPLPDSCTAANNLAIRFPSPVEFSTGPFC